MPHRNAFAKAAWMEWHRTRLQPVLDTLVSEYRASLTAAPAPTAAAAVCRECPPAAFKEPTAAAAATPVSAPSSTSAAEAAPVPPSQGATATGAGPEPLNCSHGDASTCEHMGCVHSRRLQEEIAAAHNDFVLLRNLYLGEVPTDPASRLRVGRLLCVGSAARLAGDCNLDEESEDDESESGAEMEMEEGDDAYEEVGEVPQDTDPMAA